MAITQPTYPIATSDLVTHIGNYADTRTSVNDLRSAAGRAGVAETFSRVGNTLANGNPLTSGTLRLSGFMVCRAGVALTRLNCASGATAAVTPTNQWFCVVRVSDLTVLAVTADDTTAAWAANALKDPTGAGLLIAGGPWTPSQDETCYFGVMVAAATVPSMTGVGMGTSAPAQAPPLAAGNSTTGLTTPLTVGTVVTAPTFTTPAHNIWGYAT